jgi:Uma2 family endonuclease
MSTQTSSYYEIVSRLPPGAVTIFTDVSWDEYECLLEQVGEASHLRISFDNGALQVMTLSDQHERYASFLKGVITVIQLRLRISIASFGSMTMRKPQQRKGLEADACFYVQNEHRIGRRLRLDLRTDPPPDIAVEVDVHHNSMNKLGTYAALGVPELWRFDGKALTIYLLDENSYRESETSLALPFLTSRVLTDAVLRLNTDGETAALVAFDKWLQEQHPS